MKFGCFLVLVLMIGLTGCAPDNKTLFTKLDSDDTGVKFKNQIFEDDKINILELDYVYNGGGVSVGDFNNDGYSDLFFTGNMVPNKLYLNEGDFEFKDVSDEAGIGGFYKWKSASAVVDINRDGWLDVYVCATLSVDSSLRKNMLFINQGVDTGGKLTFLDKAKEYGLDFSGFSSGGGFFDADQDGDLDLYILTNSKQPDVPIVYRPKINDGTSTNADKLFRNNGDGTFTDVSFESGIICEGYGLGLAFLDVNQDGKTDIYVGNDYITNDLLYINQGEGKFINQIDDYIKHQSKFSMGNDVADINNDGLVDIMTVDMMPETNFRKKTVVTASGYITYINDAKYGYTHQYVRNMLQLNNGDGTFSEIGQMAGVHQTEWSWSPLFADFDNDGLKDLIVTNGFPRDITDRDFINFRTKANGVTTTDVLLDQIPVVKIPNLAFKNNGDLTFSDITNKWGFSTPSFSNGAAFADLDNDGDLDYIINNINDPASVYRNNLYSNNNEEKKSHYVRIRLKDSDTPETVVGSKVTLYQQGHIQYSELALFRGYLSTVEDIIHFGLGGNSVVDSLQIIWPDGTIYRTNKIEVNRLLIYDKADVTQFKIVKPIDGQINQEKVFKSVALAENPHMHSDGEKIDFNIQRTLPHKFTQSGPGIAVGDVNSDGLEDFVLGGASQFSTLSFIQSSSGQFSKRAVGLKDKPHEDEGLLLFDADNDNDLDLYCVSGSYEFEINSINYQDRLLMNNGAGQFIWNQNALPKETMSGSCVRAADFDNDGDLDLFVGGRVPPGRYPLPDTSMLLVNNNGMFTNMIDKLAPGLAGIGMVNDAIWTDFNNDGMVDLAIVGEFMPLVFYRNTGTGFVRNLDTKIDDKVGWFNSITGADLDSDGDIDYVVGNLGTNNFYRVTANQPITVHAKDFDGNGSIDAILSCFAKSKTGELLSYPIHFWDELNAQSPKFRQRYNFFREFAEVTTDKFFSQEELNGAFILSANYLNSSIVLNQGDGSFSIKSLPSIAQVAPVNGIQVQDFDFDDNLDIALIGNDFGNEPTYGQYDAMNGIILKGDGTGNFSVIKPTQSGFKVPGDAKALANIVVGSEPVLLASQNKGHLLAFTPKIVKGKWFKPKKDDLYAILNFRDGKKQRVEFYWGSGYLTQSTRNIQIGANVYSIEVYNQSGSMRLEKLL